VTSAGKIKTASFLSQLPLFNELAPAELEQIAEATTELHVPRGELIFKRGDPCNGFHTVVYGRVKLAFTSPQGSEKVVEIIGPGHSFGEALMFMEKPYIVSAQTLVDSMLLHVSKAAIFAELGRDTNFARKMLAGLSRRLHGLICDVEAYSLNSGTQRVIGYLLKESVHHDGDRLTLHASKAVVASRLNLTPEHFSRILHDLAERKLIDVSGRDITMLNIEGLRSYDK
jgi:CRP/FNR family transcriptional regulator, dissimilatory nitrate respiration regulator